MKRRIRWDFFGELIKEIICYLVVLLWDSVDM